MFAVKPGCWYGWQQLGTHGVDPPWRVSPIYVEALKPLKTGVGLLEMVIVVLLAPLQPRRMRVRLKVASRTHEALVALCEPSGEPKRLIAVTEIDRGWMEQHCEVIVSAHDRLAYNIFATYDPEDMPIADYLAFVFGETPEAMIAGAAAARSNWPPYRTPARRTGTVPIEWGCSGMPAYLLLKGAIPRQQEHKWYIYRHEREIVFQRSWSGIWIWKAAIEVAEASTLVTNLMVNLDRRQYAYGSPEVEINRFDQCVKGVLWGREPSGSPLEPEMPRRAAAAWKRYVTAG